MTTGWEMVGSNQWTGTTIGLGPMGDYNNSEQGGIIKFFDGTLWHIQTETSGAGTYTEGLSFFERTPGSPVWEQLTADWWTNAMQWDSVPPSSGRMVDWQFGESQAWMHLHSGLEGDDKVYSFDVTGGVWGIVVFDKSDRTFVQHDIDGDAYPYCFPSRHGEHIYWMSSNGSQAGLCRSHIDSLGTLEWIQLFQSYSSYGSYEIDPSTGLPYGLGVDSSYSGYMGMAVHDDGWIYWTENSSTEAPAGNNQSYAAIRRMRTGGGDIENLMVNLANPGQTSRSFNYPDGSKDKSNGPWPIGLGWYGLRGTQARIKDDWLYWIDYGTAWESEGYTFNRVYLPTLIKNAPVTFDPFNPQMELIGGGSSGSESTARWGPYYGVQEWMIRWREGERPIYGTLDVAWCFDTDGSILFTEEGWIGFQKLGYGLGELGMRIIHRLSPPKALTANVTLKFEGNALKGYSNARQIPVFSAQDEVVLI